MINWYELASKVGEEMTNAIVSLSSMGISRAADTRDKLVEFINGKPIEYNY